uniref:C2H2-type domain-containing protein n=1 Tax=Kalanchoe fedtschenkoi TaxID=63787 RepID=A0A7N0U5K8_KALFE
MQKRPREIAVGFSSGCDEEHKCCTECGKRFGSPKALYGHMRCHPERQWRGINPPQQLARLSSPCYTGTAEEQESGVAVAAGGGDHEVAACLLMLANGSVTASHHRCNICMRAFSSGQALGGHKRCHWEKDDYQRQLPPPCLPSVLDLNSPAPAEELPLSTCSSRLNLELSLG